MEETEADFLESEMFSGSSFECSYPSTSGTDVESFLEELMRNTHSCTHTHTCNPPTGAEKKHTHTCYHTHTQLFASAQGSDEADDLQSKPASKKHRPAGNREAVKKYREKKKAQTAHLEEQVQQLKAMNSQLFKRLQGQAAMEAEVVRLRPFEVEVKRLRAMMSEFRGRIDGELGSSYSTLPQPVKDGSNCTVQPLAGGFYLNSFTVPCDAEVQCLHGADTPVAGGMGDQGGSSHGNVQQEQFDEDLWLRECEVESLDCQLGKGREKPGYSKKCCKGTTSRQ